MLPVARMHSERCSAKLVYDSHELYSEQSFSTHVKTRWAQIEAKHIGACHSVITINPSIARELERRYGIPKAHVIYNAERSGAMIQRNKFFREIFRLKDDDKTVLFQGGLSAGRNLETLIEAMVHVRSPFVHLVIMGDGRLGAALAKAIRRLGLSHRVHLHPAVPQKELLAATAGADAGVIPYQATCLNNYYCTPNKLFEFIAAGIPILASDLPEIRRIIESHNIGMLADLSSAKKTARSIDHFFSDAQRFKIWQAQVEKARSVICWEREAEKLVAIFEALR
jgi:glycosyltransferase involved in cell wall biosynthesis